MDNAVTFLKTDFTGPVPTCLSLVATVADLTFAYGGGRYMKTLPRIVFGLGMAIEAVSFTSWLSPSRMLKNSAR